LIQTAVNMKNLVFTTLACVMAISAYTQLKNSDRSVGDGCDGCDAMFDGMPSKLDWQTKIAPPGEPGEPMTISGTIYQADGKTPAPGVILYLYHTDNKGIYSPAPNQKVALRHGHLRGWMKSDAKGRYLFTSIRPGSYPSRKAPQHIHPLVKEPGVSLYWIDEFVFDDDELLTKEALSHNKNRGGSGLIHLTKNEEGEWTGKRDIILGKNISNY
jgi:protocatechuate 3,4-dioxygenase beta subunit